jgi:hypothetical protein
MKVKVKILIITIIIEICLNIIGMDDLVDIVEYLSEQGHYTYNLRQNGLGPTSNIELIIHN